MTREEIIQKGLQLQSDYEKNNKPAPQDVKGIPMQLNIGGESVYCLHYPSKNRKNGPVYIDIHGGGFLWAYPEEDDLLCDNVNRTLDIEVYSLEYPRGPLHRFPEGIESLYKTIAYMSDHAEKFNFDANQIALGGHSAGGNLTAALLFKNQQEQKFKVKCQVLDYPCVDNRADAIKPEMFKEGDILSIELMDFFRLAYCTDADSDSILCSPILASREELKGLPPTVIMTCGNDVLRFQGRAYAEKLRNADVAVMHFEYPNVTHAFDVFPGSDMEKGQNFLISGIKYFMEL